MKKNSTRITADDLLIEIFKRIPCKTLARFRCVSKHWNHLFRRPDFASTHYNYSKTHAAATPTLVLLSITHKLKRIFYTINDEGEAHHHLTIDTQQFGFKSVCLSPQVVNGICCLFEFHNVLVCNTATGEIVRLPDSSLTFDYGHVWLFLGFDPENDEYKVLRFWTHARDSSSAAESEVVTWEVFTVGMSRVWRNIGTMPCIGINFCSQSVCVNGIIHWVSIFDDGDKSGLVSFNVKEEKLQIRELPPNIWGDRIGRSAQVVQFKGHLAIVNRGESKMLMLGDDDENWIHGFKKDFKFPSEHRDLVITRNLERFIVLEASRHSGDLKLVHYENDDIRLKSTKITGVTDYPWLAAISEHVENIYGLARNNSGQKKKKNVWIP